MRRPPLLENQNCLRLRRLRLEISSLFPPNYLFCAIGLRSRKTSGYTDAEGREEVGVARLTPTVLTDCDHSLNWGITGHRDPPRRSSDCDGACLSGFWGYRPSSPGVERADLFCSLAAGRDLPVWTTGGRASTVWGLRMVYRQTFGCDSGRPERVICQSVGSKFV